MICKKIKNRKRVVLLGDGDFYETEGGAKFPIKSKPMIFSDLQLEYNNYIQKIKGLEAQRAKDGVDVEEYVRIMTEYLNLFYEIVIMVSKFNGYEIDKEFIRVNMSNEDTSWYVASVENGFPLYTAEDYLKKKMK